MIARVLFWLTFYAVTVLARPDTSRVSAAVHHGGYQAEQKTDPKEAGDAPSINSVNDFLNHLSKGLLGRDEQFNLRDPDMRAQTLSMMDAIRGLKTEEAYTIIGNWLLGTANFEQFAYAMIRASMNRPDLGLKDSQILPHWYETHSNYFVEDKILREIKAAVENGTYDQLDIPLIVPDESDVTSYFRNDPELNSMFYNWNIYFPSWIDPERYGGENWPTRGELFYDFHHQLVTAYYLRSSTRRVHWDTLWKDPIKEGYNTGLVNSAGVPFSSRNPNSSQVENEHREKLLAIAGKIKAIYYEGGMIHVNDSYSIPLNSSEETMLSILSNIVYNTVDSVNSTYYGSLYEAATSYLASLGSDPSKDYGGLSGHPLTALRDPAFYAVLAYTNGLVEAFKTWKMRDYTQEEVWDKDLVLVSMDVDRLETFFEPFDINLRIWLGKRGEPKRYIVQQLRLNHKPFIMKFNVTNKSERSKPALITVYLTRDIYRGGFDPDPVSHPIDSFKAVVEPGDNLIERDISESKIFTGDRRSMIPCGIPKTLLLPKGTEEGLRMSMFAMITPYVGSAQENRPTEDVERSPLCGNLRLNHGRSFGFPMDRGPAEVPASETIAYCNATIYHVRNTFRGGVYI